MTAHPSSTSAHSPRWLGRAKLALPAVLLMLAPGTQAQSSTEKLLSIARSDLHPLLQHDDPVVRGEAALALALGGDATDYPAILAIARDKKAAARLRGILALGYLATPGAESFLGRVVLDTRRPEAERAAAAFALSQLPAENTTAIERYLRQVRDGSYRRHSGTLAALLAGLAQRPHRSTTGSLQGLFDDRANRDPRTRRLVLTALAATPSGLSDIELDDSLEASETRQLAVLAAMTRTGHKLVRDDHRQLEQFARKAPTPRVRAEALDLLTDLRQLAALELGVRALRSDAAIEVAAGARALWRLGGGALRLALQSRILETSDPTVRMAMMAACERPTSRELVDECLRIAVDRKQPRDLRIAATALVARAREPRAGAALRDLFRESETSGELDAIAQALVALDPHLLDPAQVFPPTSAQDLQRLPRRLAALLRAQHPDAETMWLTAMRSPRLDDSTRAELISAMRNASAPPLSDDARELIPAELAALLR